MTRFRTFLLVAGPSTEAATMAFAAALTCPDRIDQCRQSQANWLNTGHWQIELWCDDHLPVTETGYRSQFVSDPDFVDQSNVSALVTDWLDHEARSRQ